jgi:plastocyanin
MLAVHAAASAEDAPSGADGVGQITGLVQFTGKVPPPKQIMTSDGSTLLHSVLIVDAKTNGLLHVVAFLEDAPARAKLKAVKPAVIDQRDWVFIPRLAAVQYGQEVRFENNDLVNHSVEAVSLVKANQFNSIAGPGQPIKYTFEAQKGPVQIGCSLHPWMRAWVYVFSHSWFGITSADGRFHIRDVPPGKYTLVIVHPDSNLRERRVVEIVAGKPLDVHVNWEKLPGG